jgi:hypothetical protein
MAGRPFTTEAGRLRHGAEAVSRSGGTLAISKAPLRSGAAYEGTANARFMWLWASGRCLGVTDDERRARVHAERAAVSQGWKAHLELVSLGTGSKLEPVYVPTGIGYDGIMLGGRLAWTRAAPTAVPDAARPAIGQIL